MPYANYEQQKTKQLERYHSKKAEDPDWYKSVLERQREWLRVKYATDAEWRTKRKTEKLERQKANRATANERNRRYRQRHPEKAKAYRQRPEVKVKLIERQRLFRSSEEGCKRARARAAVNDAIRSGKMLRPVTCSRCPNGSPHGHHHKGYEPEHWLDVLWLCRACHKPEHHPKSKTA